MALPQASDVDLTGLIDAHIHSAPDVWPRIADDVEIAGAAAAAGLRAILLKSHVTITADRAAMAEKAVGGLRVFGALSLNGQVGGLNPAAVDAALKLGAREIWLPTQDATNHRRWEESLKSADRETPSPTPEAVEHRRRQVKSRGGLSVLNEEGRLKPVVQEIVAMVRDAGAVLGTGHISVPEIVAVVRFAREIGHRRVSVTHPEAPMIRMPSETQREIAGEGVFFERCYVNTTSFTGAMVGVAEVVSQIRAVGVESTVLSTDLGQATNIPPVDGFRTYLAELIARGFSLQEVRLMAGVNPAQLLGF